MKAPGTWTLEQMFAGRPAARGLFEVVRQYIESLGPVTLEVTKTQVSFGTKRKFAWVWLPQMWISKQPDESITLTFALPRKTEDPRIRSVVEPRPGRFTHHVVITKESDFDTRVREWLQEAFERSRGYMNDTQR